MQSTLDVALKGYEIKTPILIKIDTQGYELEILRGNRKWIESADAVICEVSFESLYVGQPLFDDIYCFLRSCGFTFKGSLEQLKAVTDRRILQCDAIFTKN
jgi:hypothetical protein